MKSKQTYGPWWKPIKPVKDGNRLTQRQTAKLLANMAAAKKRKRRPSDHEHLLWRKMSRPAFKGRHLVKAGDAPAPAGGHMPTPADVAKILKDRDVCPMTSKESVQWWELRSEHTLPSLDGLEHIPERWLHCRTDATLIEGWRRPAEPWERETPPQRSTIEQLAMTIAWPMVKKRLLKWKMAKRLRRFRNSRLEAWLSDCALAICEAPVSRPKGTEDGFYLSDLMSNSLTPEWRKKFHTLAFHRLTEGWDVAEQARTKPSDSAKRYGSDQFWETAVLPEDKPEQDPEQVIVKMATALGLRPDSKKDMTTLKVITILVAYPNATRSEQIKMAGISRASFLAHKSKTAIAKRLISKQ